MRVLFSQNSYLYGYEQCLNLPIHIVTIFGTLFIVCITLILCYSLFLSLKNKYIAGGKDDIMSDFIPILFVLQVVNIQYYMIDRSFYMSVILIYFWFSFSHVNLAYYDQFYTSNQQHTVYKIQHASLVFLRNSALDPPRLNWLLQQITRKKYCFKTLTEILLH